MKQRINFEAKTDRELLLLTAQTANEICDRLDTLNGNMQGHEKRIRKLENATSLYEPQKHNIKGKVNHSGFIILLSSLIGGSVYAFGCAMGWW